MRSIAILIPNLSDATSFYRGIGPLGRLANRHSTLNLVALNQWSWATITACHAIFMQRPFTNEHRETLEICKANNKKVWVDYDDLLFDVPTDNPTFFQYMSEPIQDNIRYMISNADIVSVSTEALKEAVSEFAKDVRVVPNAIDLARFPYRRDPPRPREKRILWRGSKTHHRDVMAFAKPIKTMSKIEGWNWNFVGDNVWFMTDAMPHERTFITKAMDPIEYNMFIWQIAPSAMMVPLFDNHFNRCKSNIAQIEAAFCGAVAIVPDWPEWRLPGSLTYSSLEQFESALEAMLGGHVDVEQTARSTWDHVKEHLSLDVVNQKRIQILCDLMECDPKDLRSP